MDPLILDLEAVAIDGAEHFVEASAAPANYKDPAKIADWQAENRVKRIERAALDVDLARIVVLGVQSGTDVEQWACETDAAEKAALEAFAAEHNGRQLVTFNGYAYDLALLGRRYLYHGLPVPMGLWPIDRYRTNHIDLYEWLNGRGLSSAHSLSWYARRLGWVYLPDDPLPNGGADVSKALTDGRMEDILTHNSIDLMRTKLLAKWAGVIP